jgi:hypothetical protein
MQDAQYFRARAEFCRQLADQLSDRSAATRVRSLAAEYTTKADQIDAVDAATSPRQADMDRRA